MSKSHLPRVVYHPVHNVYGEKSFDLSLSRSTAVQGMKGVECRVWDVGCGVWGVGCGVWCGVQGMGCGVWSVGGGVHGRTCA